MAQRVPAEGSVRPEAKSDISAGSEPLAGSGHGRIDRVGTNTLERKAEPMKKIEAIIKPFKLDEVKDALHEIGLQGHHRGRGQGLRAPEGPYRALPRRRIRRRFPAEGEDRGGLRPTTWSERAVEAITQAARTGRIGDGKIFVSEIQEVIRIRTGERGDDAV